jgi:lysophospholipase L1-like esterase
VPPRRPLARLLHRRSISALAISIVLTGATGLAAAGAVAVGVADGPQCGDHWVTTWTTAPQGTVGPYDDQTIRALVPATTGGSAVRITLSNRFGKVPVSYDDVHVARSAGGADVDPSSIRPVRFGGEDSIVVPAGDEVTSDRIDLRVAPGEDLAVSYHVPGPSMITSHTRGQRVTYATRPSSGEHGSDATGEAFTEQLQSWVGVTAVDVEAPGSVGAIAALGDSLTDGDGATFAAGTRWTDRLARQLDGRFAVLNAGIGGTLAARPFVPESNPLSKDVPGGAHDRLDSDLLRRSGVTDLVVYIGINDILFSLDPDPVASVIKADTSVIEEAHRAGLNVIGVTLTPGRILDEHRDAQRREVNEWIRTSGAFDHVLDFDHAVADPTATSHLLPSYDHDGIHMTDAGYAALADAIDTSIFDGTGCPTGGQDVAPAPPRLAGLDDDPRTRDA